MSEEKDDVQKVNRQRVSDAMANVIKRLEKRVADLEAAQEWSEAAHARAQKLELTKLAVLTGTPLDVLGIDKREGE